MNGPAPGWQPDPTGRHEYRYWDGTRWSDDVSDGGVASNDPVAGAPEPTQAFGAPDHVPPATSQPTYQAGYDPSGYDTGSGAGYGAGGYGATGGSGPGGPGVPGGPGGPGFPGGPGGPTPGGYGSGGYSGYGAAPPQPGSGPSTGLLVGLGALVVVLILGIVFVVLNSGDDDDTATTDETTTTTAGTDTTEPTDPSTTTVPDDSGDSGDGSSSAIVSAISEGIVDGSGGAITQEEGDCMAQAMVDEIGVERLIELGLEASEGTTDPLDVLTSDEQDAVYGAMRDCVGGGSLDELPGG